jgi:hypothetical protein
MVAYGRRWIGATQTRASLTTDGGGVTRHEGPRKAWFFTKEQARKLARRVNDTLTIDLTYWDTGDANEY